jgi:hypothetical protein
MSPMARNGCQSLTFQCNFVKLLADAFLFRRATVRVSSKSENVNITNGQTDPIPLTIMKKIGVPSVILSCCCWHLPRHSAFDAASCLDQYLIWVLSGPISNLSLSIHCFSAASAAPRWEALVHNHASCPTRESCGNYFRIYSEDCIYIRGLIMSIFGHGSLRKHVEINTYGLQTRKYFSSLDFICAFKDSLKIVGPVTSIHAIGLSREGSGGRSRFSKNKNWIVRRPGATRREARCSFSKREVESLYGWDDCDKG